MPQSGGKPGGRGVEAKYNNGTAVARAQVQRGWVEFPHMEETPGLGWGP